ncbi:hypothetical protein MMC30_003764 [Trapelia coarctata]|nr:hypothetical protein [Trapelia coarctata]
MSEIGRKNMTPSTAYQSIKWKPRHTDKDLGAQDVTPNNMKSTQERLRDTTNKTGGYAAGGSKPGNQSASGSKA